MSLKPYELFEALERGDVVEVSINCEVPQWGRWNGNSWYSHCVYRIAPKKERSLVEELREADEKGRYAGDLLRRAADHMEELEGKTQAVPVKIPLELCATYELLAEIKRRMT